VTRAGRATARRRRWHPVTAGSGLLVAALAVGVAALAGAGRLPPAGWSGGWPGGWLPPAGWLLVGASAGFATSGST
jgi:hypothetical protein